MGRAADLGDDHQKAIAMYTAADCQLQLLIGDMEYLQDESIERAKKAGVTKQQARLTDESGEFEEEIQKCMRLLLGAGKIANKLKDWKLQNAIKDCMETALKRVAVVNIKTLDPQETSISSAGQTMVWDLEKAEKQFKKKGQTWTRPTAKA